MSKKKAKKERIYVVDDFTPFIEARNEGKLTASEAEAIFGEARYTGLMNGEDAEDYIRDFGKPVLFLGASNAGAVVRLSPYTTRYYLQLEKTRKAVKAITPATEWIFALGHEAEPFVANIGCRMLNDKGVNVRWEDCPYGYVNSRWPHVLIHPDVFLLGKEDASLLFLGEIKTSHHKSNDWVLYFSVDEVPPHYDAQAQVMMRILNIEYCYFLVWNKTGDEDGFRQLLVKRDDARAERYLGEMEKFCEDTLNGIFYEDDELLPDEINAVFSEAEKRLGYVELPKKLQKHFEQIAELAAERDALKAEIAEPLNDLREIEKQIKLLKSRCYGSIRKAPGGYFTVGDATYRMDVRRSFSLSREVLAEMEARHPELHEVWDEMKAIQPRVSSRIVKISGGRAEEIIDEGDAT